MTRPDLPGYRLGSLIAQGSSSTVWAATPSDGKDDLAIKVVPLGDRDQAERLSFELSALTATRAGEHLIEVRDVVAVADPQPAIAIVMPRLRHGSLARLVNIRGHLKPGEVITMLTPVALTIAQLHDSAVVHGDLSAANIGFDGGGRPIVLDLGVCTVVGTPRELVYGTPGFIAPEVVAGGPATPAADVYALGALGWFALTGEPPPLPADRQPLAEQVPGVAPAMEQALEQALDPDPTARGDGRALAAAVYAAGTAVPIRPVSGDDPAQMLTHRVRDLARAEADPESAPTRAARRVELRTRHRAAHLRVLAMFVAALVLGVAGIAVANLGRGAPVAPTQGTGIDAATGDSADEADPAGSAGSTGGLSAVDIETSPAVDYAGVVQRLVDVRARAWTSGDPGQLAGVFAPASDHLEHDEMLISSAAAAGHGYTDLAFVVDQVHVLSESTERVTLQTTVQTSRYAVHTEAGSGVAVEERPAVTSRVTLTLVRTDGDWRIAAVMPIDT